MASFSHFLATFDRDSGTRGRQFEQTWEQHMASKHQMTGMLGVYLTAAELISKGLIVSITSRTAKVADLLATDQSYKRTWAIQLKTNRKAAKFWLLNKSYNDFANAFLCRFSCNA
jgi:hypothetical protein